MARAGVSYGYMWGEEALAANCNLRFNSTCFLGPSER
jgi:hypothetical protein